MTDGESGAMLRAIFAGRRPNGALVGRTLAGLSNEARPARKDDALSAVALARAGGTTPSTGARAGRDLAGAAIAPRPAGPSAGRVGTAVATGRLAVLAARF